MLLWALCYPLITIGLDDSPPLLFAFIRATLSGLVLLIIAIALKRPPIEGKRNWLGIVAVALTATTIGFWGMFYAGGILSPGLATVLTNTQPLIAVGLGWFILNEKLSRASLLGLLVGFVGIVIISIESMSLENPVILRGLSYLLLGTMGIAVSNVILKSMTAKVDIIYAMGWQLVLGAIPLGFMSLYLEDISDLQWTMRFTITLIVLSFLGTSFAFVLWFWLLGKFPLYQVNSYTFLTPILGLGIGYHYFSETLSPAKLFGATIVLVGIWLVNGRGLKSATKGF